MTLKSNGYYDEPMKVDCLYYFHKNSILEIPIYEENHNYERLKKEVRGHLSRGITGHLYCDKNTEFKVDMNEILPKLI